MKTTSKIIAAILIIGIVLVVWMLLPAKAVAPYYTATSTPVVTGTTTAYSMADIAKHANRSDCWTAVAGKVYDVTTFIPSHPGGEEIVKVCGKDGTRLFSSEDEHAEQNAQVVLDAYQIGILK